MSSADKEAGTPAPRPHVDMDNPQDVSRMLTAGYGLSGEGFHYHSFRSIVRDAPVDAPEEADHDDAPDMHEYAGGHYAEPEYHAPAEPAPEPEPVVAAVAMPPIVEEVAPPPPPPPPPPVVPEAVHVPPPQPAPVVEPVAPPPPETVVSPAPQPEPAAATIPDAVQTGGRERRGLPPFAEPPVAPRPAPAPARSAPFTVEAPEPVVTATDDWAPVPKAQQRRGQRPTGPGFFFARAGDRTQMARLFQPAPVPVSRPVSKPASKVTTMTKLDKNSWNESAGRRPAPTDNSPTLTEVFMTLGGRATDRLIPKPSLREALLRKREEENEQS